VTCTNPVSAWRHPNNNPDNGAFVILDTGTGEITNKPLSGVSFKYVDGWDTLWLACGKCEGCRADQAREWAIRCYHESSLHDKNCFVTLTYDQDHLPFDGKINKTHLQKFFRSLRDRGHKIRYFACGEYGGQTRRPHYHALLFGNDFKDDFEVVGNTASISKYSTGNGSYVSPLLTRAWGRGYVQCDEVNMSTISYVAGYTAKKIGDPDTFNLMSRRPGIGRDWLKRYYDDLSRTGMVNIEGQNYPVPSKYLEMESEKLHAVKEHRRKYVEEHGRATDLQLESKKRNYQSRIKHKEEKL
jgi:hypothetical protein